MMMLPTDNPYLFISKRLGFRHWRTDDIAPMSVINADNAVMAFFPQQQNVAQTHAFIDRMEIQLNEKGYTYFAVDHLADAQFIGFIGLSCQTYEAPFTPCIDLGWRLHPNYWRMGLATEGAVCCIQYARDQLGLAKIYAVAPVINQPSIRVMEKAGLTKEGTFQHPLLTDFAQLRECVCYAKNLLIK